MNISYMVYQNFKLNKCKPEYIISSKTPYPLFLFSVLCGSTIPCCDCSSQQPGNCLLVPLTSSPEHLSSSSPTRLNAQLPSPVYPFFPCSGSHHSWWPPRACFLIFYLQRLFSTLLPEGAFKR